MNAGKSVSRNIIAARNLRRLVESNYKIRTQERFAELMDVDVRTVRRWYAAFNSLSRITEAAEVLGVSDLDILLVTFYALSLQGCL